MKGSDDYDSGNPNFSTEHASLRQALRDAGREVEMRKHALSLAVKAATGTEEDLNAIRALVKALDDAEGAWRPLVARMQEARDAHYARFIERVRTAAGT